MIFEKLFMKYILPVLMVGATFGIILLIMFILPDDLIGLMFYLVSCIIFMAVLGVSRKLYSSWLPTRQDEIKERLRQRAKAEGREVEESLDIILKYIEDKGLLVDY